MWHVWELSVGRPEGKSLLRRLGHGWEDNVEIEHIKGMGWRGLD